ncbi:hypothetical protein FRC03_002834, partial [Tulasnella sp. 419]
KKARDLTSYSSTGPLPVKLDYDKAVSHLSYGLHAAIGNYRVQSTAPNPALPPRREKSTREISGRVVGALSIAEKMLDGVPVPGLKAAVGGLLGVVGAINKLIDNDDDLVKLTDHLQRLLKIVTKPMEDSDTELNIAFEQRIEDLTEDIEQITADAMKLKEQNIGSRFLGSADNASAIMGLSLAIDRAVDRFQVSGTMVVERGIGGIRTGISSVKDGVERVEDDIGEVKYDVGLIGTGVGRIQYMLESTHLSEIEERALNAIQPRADSARYDFTSQSSSSFCLEDTRVALLKNIEQWAEDSKSPPILWLCGMAGTGKSTIARTVAKHFDDCHYLGASFFFSRDEDNRRTTNLVFPTVAYQLARRIPSLRDHIVKVATPDVCTAMMRTQLNKLIVEPLRNCNPHSSLLVIVMDALDECAKESQITEMLVLLAPAIRLVRDTIDIKLFLTSRPEVHISSEFREPGMEAVSGISILHDIEKSLVRADISRYVDHHLRRIAKVILPRHVVWPTLEEKETLINMADGLFIFAAVTIAYIGDIKHRQPKQRLRNILSASDQNQASVSFMHLDNLYQQILMASLPEIDKGEDAQALMLRVREILGTVVLLLYPLSSRSLEMLLQWEEDTVEPTLGPFHSVLSISSDPTPIRVFHKSFPDFLTDKRRSGDFWFHIDLIEHHARLALLCLTHMNTSLSRDMCGVGNRLLSELDDVEIILQKKIEGHVLYACRHWAAHLKETMWTEELGAALKIFCEHKLLYWLEILCLDKRLSSAILALDSARKWTLDAASAVILANCYRYLLYYQSTTSLGPSHIYQSTLPFIPCHDLSSSPWEKELQNSPRVVMTNGSDTWDRILFTLTGHSSAIYAVAYSPDGVLIASGSDDKTIIVWDSRTGAQIHSLEGHSKEVLAVDFSADGSLIASGSNDRSVRIWSSITGTLVHTLDGHSDNVRAVSFSPIGNIVASGSLDKTVILWDSVTGSRIMILDGLSDSIWSVAFSPDGTKIAAGSSDLSIIIWDTETGTMTSRLKGNEPGSNIYSVAFSPDGNRLASASEKEVILWGYKSHSILKRPDATAYCVAFSPDGRSMIAGRRVGQIATWDVASGSEIGIFSGHADAVVSLAVSPDGSRIITGSWDGTAAVWDMSSGWESPGGSDDPDQKVHQSAVRCIAFSPDGNRLVYGTMDDSLAVWDIGGHALIHTLIDHHDTVTTVAFSTDGRYIASGSEDRRIILWDVETGKSIKTLNLGGTVRFLEFSLDGQYLVATYDVPGFGARSGVVKWSTSWKKWSTQSFEECQPLLTEEEAKQVLSGSPAGGAPPSGTYLARDQGSQWVEKRCQGTKVERLCHLPQHDITVSASFGHHFAFGTERGTTYVLDFSPETFGITSTTMYTDSVMFGSGPD